MSVPPASADSGTFGRGVPESGTTGPREGRALPLLPLMVGSARLTVSRLGLGTHGLQWLRTGDAQSLLRQAFELGIRYLDTAPLYGNGLAEAQIGRFAAGRRADLVITTKFGLPVSRLPSRVPGLLLASRAVGAVARRLGAAAPRRDYSAAEARTSLEQSLRELRTDHVDVLYLHEPEMSLLQSNMEPLLSTLQSLKASGKVRHIGLSGQAAACTAIAQAHPALAEVLQVEVPADAQGLPAAAGADAAASVRFWEFPAVGTRPPALPEVMRRLGRIAPQGVILLSTRDAGVLREAAKLVLDGVAHA